jgi:hypothetical protein
MEVNMSNIYKMKQIRYFVRMVSLVIVNKGILYLKRAIILLFQGWGHNKLLLLRNIVQIWFLFGGLAIITTNLFLRMNLHNSPSIQKHLASLC